ncbi:Arv1-like family protein [Erysiphe pulchra]|uniref:Protein ARV n=1 Tax=Erysiphe pulchra TaxID=225359 RepID=A0A2S4Q015_9PEZI|nr:Arv1-like family protein [Erysiphe pulchra]
MPICVECRFPVRTLYTEYSGAGDKSSGHGVRLTVCQNCGRFCDKYVEHDYVVLFIDLVLIKPQPSIIRLGILLLLFDVYLTWARIERQTSSSTTTSYDTTNFLRLAQKPIIFQYLFFLILCAISTLAFHLSIRFLTSSPYSPLVKLGLLSRYSRPNSVSTALLVSSSTKLFPILMVIWEYDVPAAARSLGWAVVANNVEALKILLDCGYGTAAIIATFGVITRSVIGRGILWITHLDRVGIVRDLNDAARSKPIWAAIELGREWGGRLGFR